MTPQKILLILIVLGGTLVYVMALVLTLPVLVYVGAVIVLAAVALAFTGTVTNMRKDGGR